MRSVFKFILFTFVMVLSAMTSAANKVGNGGNVVSCKAQEKTTTVLLDFYESEISPKSDGKSAFDRAESILNKLKATAPKLAGQYIQRLAQIQSEIAYKEDIQLVDIPDSKHLFKPLSKDCEVLQVAVRNNVAPVSGKRFLIRKDLWDQLDSIQQAGLLTHEIIYEHLTKLGEENSVKARRINAFIYTDNTKSGDFWKLIKELEIPIYP